MHDGDSVEILLDEDSASDEELTIHAFDKYNANKLHVARDGERALDFIFCGGAFGDRQIEGNPKVVLLDLKLPKGDGLEVLRQIKSDPQTKHIPVVLLTSSQEERDIIAGYQYGADSYIIQPVGFRRLTKAVQEIGMYWLILNKAQPGHFLCSKEAPEGYVDCDSTLPRKRRMGRLTPSVQPPSHPVVSV